MTEAHSRLTGLAALELEQLDGGRIIATDDEATTLAAVEQALTASGWYPSQRWQNITSARAVVAGNPQAPMSTQP